MWRICRLGGRNCEDLIIREEWGGVGVGRGWSGIILIIEVGWE